jgi:hypothetical protein
MNKLQKSISTLTCMILLILLTQTFAGSKSPTIPVYDHTGALVYRPFTDEHGKVEEPIYITEGSYCYDRGPKHAPDCMKKASVYEGQHPVILDWPNGKTAQYYRFRWFDKIPKGVYDDCKDDPLFNLRQSYHGSQVTVGNQDTFQYRMVKYNFGGVVEKLFCVPSQKTDKKGKNILNEACYSYLAY